MSIKRWWIVIWEPLAGADHAWRNLDFAQQELNHLRQSPHQAQKEAEIIPVISYAEHLAALSAVKDRAKLEAYREIMNAMEEFSFSGGKTFGYFIDPLEAKLGESEPK